MLQFAALASFHTEIMAFAIGAASLIVAGAVAAREAPRRKLLVGVALAIPAGFIFGFADSVFGLLGGYSSEWPGPLSSLLVAILTAPIGLLLATMGALLGARYAARGVDV